MLDRSGPGSYLSAELALKMLRPRLNQDWQLQDQCRISLHRRPMRVHRTQAGIDGGGSTSQAQSPAEAPQQGELVPGIEVIPLNPGWQLAPPVGYFIKDGRRVEFSG